MTKAYRLHIENFLTVKELDIDLSPGVQGFVGENAAGKTNILTAVQSILNGKHDTRLIKDGEKRSEIRLEEIKNDEVVAHVSRIQTQKNSRLEGAGVSHTTPKKWLESLLDEVAINPINLISGDPVKYLKQHLKIEALKSDVIDVPTMQIFFNDRQNAFAECERISDDIKVTRVSQYQVMRHNKELVDELRKDLPAEPQPPKFSRSELDDQKAFVRAKEINADKTNASRDEFKEEIRQNEEQREVLVERVIADQKRIEFLVTEVDKANFNLKIDSEEALTKMKEAIAKVESDYKERVAQIEASFDGAKSDVASKKEGLEKRIEADNESILRYHSQIGKQLDRLNGIKKVNSDEIKIEKQDIETLITELVRYEEIQQRYKNLSDKELLLTESKVLYEELDSCFKHYAYELPKKLVERADLPVEGLEFRDEDLYVNDRHIERLSSSERHSVAVDLAIALAKAKKQVCVCLDGIEIFSDENRKSLIERLSKSEIKVLYTRWGQVEGSHETEVRK